MASLINVSLETRTPFNSSNDLVGLVSRGYPRYPTLNFMVPLTDIQTFLKEVKNEI